MQAYADSKGITIPSDLLGMYRSMPAGYAAAYEISPKSYYSGIAQGHPSHKTPKWAVDNYLKDKKFFYSLKLQDAAETYMAQNAENQSKNIVLPRYIKLAAENGVPVNKTAKIISNASNRHNQILAEFNARNSNKGFASIGPINLTGVGNALNSVFGGLGTVVENAYKVVADAAAKVDDKVLAPVVKAGAKVEDVVKEEILSKPAGQLLLAVAMPYAASYLAPYLAAAGIPAAYASAVATAVAQTTVAVASGVPFDKAVEAGIINASVNIGADKLTPYVNAYVKNPQVTNAIVNATATVAQGVASGQSQDQIMKSFGGSLAGSTTGLLDLVPGYSDLPIPAKNVINSSLQAQLLDKDVNDAATYALITSGVQSAANGVIAYKKISDKLGRPATAEEVEKFAFYSNPAQVGKDVDSYIQSKTVTEDQVRKAFEKEGVTNLTPQQIEKYVKTDVDQEKSLAEATAEADSFATTEEEIVAFFNTFLERDPTPEEVMAFKGQFEEFKQLQKMEGYVDPFTTDTSEVTEFFKDKYGRDPSEAELKALATTSPEDTLDDRADQAIRKANTEAFETLAGYKPEEGGLGINVVTDPLFAQARLDGMSDFEPPPKPFVDPNKFNINPFSKEAYVIDIDADGNQRQIKVAIDSATNKLIPTSGSLEDEARMMRSLERMGVKSATMPSEVLQALAHYNPDLLKTGYVSPATKLNQEEAKALLGIMDIEAKTAPQQASKLYKATEFFKTLGKTSPLGTLFDLLTYTGEAGAPQEIEFEKLQKARREAAELWEALNPAALKPLRSIDIDPSGRDVTTLVLDYDSQGNPIEYYVPTIVKSALDTDADNVIGYDSKGQQITRDNYVIKNESGEPMRVDKSAHAPQRVTQEDLDRGIIGYSTDGKPVTLERLFPDSPITDAVIAPPKDPTGTLPIDIPYPNLIPNWKPLGAPDDETGVIGGDAGGTGGTTPTTPPSTTPIKPPDYTVTINPETGKPWDYVPPTEEKKPDVKPVKPKVTVTKTPLQPEEMSFAQQFNPQDSTSYGVAPKALKPTFLASQETNEQFSSPLGMQAPEELQETIQAPQEYQTFTEEQPSDVDQFRDLLNLQNEQIVTPAQEEQEQLAQFQQPSPLSLSDMTQSTAPEMPMYYKFGQLGAPETSPYYKFGELQSIDSFFNPDYQNLQAAKGGLVAPLMAAGGATGTRYGRYASGGMSTPLMAAGGKLRVDFRHGDAVSGEGDGQSDDIPAMLADGEFVFPADVVAAIGNGSTKAGSDKLYDMMHGIRAHVRSAKPQDLPPEIKSPLDFLHRKPKKARR